MGKILIVGKLKNKIQFEGRNILIKDSVNDLSTDFIIRMIKDNQKYIGYENKDYIDSEDTNFKDQIVSYATQHLIYNGKQFNLTLSRKTYDSIIIECYISYDDTNNFDNELFGEVYDFKIKLKEWLKKYCKLIYWIYDDNNSRICLESYRKIHMIENRLRQILSLFMIKKCGDIYLCKDLEQEYNRYSGFYKDSGYIDFKDINSKLYNIGFAKLPKLLDMNVSQAIIDEESTIKHLVDNIIEQLDRVGDITYTYKKINELQKKLNKEINKINKGEHIFDDRLLKILDNDFKDEWNTLTGMRNMVMHNKPICKSLFHDIQDLCNKENARFNRCMNYIESRFYTEEEAIFYYLCDEQEQSEQYQKEFIEQERENAGVQFLLDKDYVMERLTQDDPQITELLLILEEIKESYNKVEEIYSYIDEIDEHFKEKDKEQAIEEINNIASKLNIKIKFNNINNIGNTIVLSITNKYDMEQLYKNLVEDNKIDDKFSISEIANFKDFIGNEYKVIISGELDPGDDSFDYIDCSVYKNNKVQKTISIEIDYGSYENHREGGINCESMGVINKLLKEIMLEIQKDIGTLYQNIKQIMSICKMS